MREGKRKLPLWVPAIILWVPAMIVAAIWRLIQKLRPQSRPGPDLIEGLVIAAEMLTEEDPDAQ